MHRRLFAALGFGAALVVIGPAWAQEHSDAPPETAHHAGAQEHADEAPTADAPAAAEHERPGAPEHTVAKSDAASTANEEDADADDGEGAGLDAEDAAAFDGAALDAKRLADVLRAQLEKVREKVLAKMEQKIDAKTERKLDAFGRRMGFFSLAGLLLLFAPLWLRRKYPGKGAVLVKYSALAAVSFVVCVNLFTGVAAIMKGAQSATGKLTNPQIAITAAVFDSLHDNAEQIVETGIEVVKPTVNDIERGETADPLPSAFMGNIVNAVRTVANPTAIETVLSVRRFVKRVDWAFGYYPIVMTLYGLGMFVLGMKPMLREIVELPGRAATDPEAARAALKGVFKRIGREFLSTLCLVFALLAVTLAAGAFLGLAMRPAVDVFLSYLVASFMYLKTVHDASGAVLLVSLASTVLFLVLNFAVIVIASSLFMGKLKTIFKDKFHGGIALRAHAPFFGWGTLSLVLTLALPALFARLADPLVSGPIEHAFVTEGGVRWTEFLMSGPLVMVLGFLVTFWIARGVHMLFFLKVYRRVAPALAARAARALTAVTVAEPAPAAEGVPSEGWASTTMRLAAEPLPRGGHSYPQP